MPEIRPFRALRYDRAASAILALVVAPPYDVIDPEQRARSLARHPANVVRSTCPPRRPATSPTIATGGRRARWRPGARTARCARTRTRRSTSTSRPTWSRARTRSGPSAGSSPDCGSSRSGRMAGCCRTSGRCAGPERGPLQAPACDRREHQSGRRRSSRTRRGKTGERLAGSQPRARPTLEVTDDDGVRHRLWAVAADGEGASADDRRRADGRGRRSGRSRSPTATTATRRRCATATSAG